MLYRRFVLPQKINAIAHTDHCDHGCGYKLICQRSFYGKYACTVDNSLMVSLILCTSCSLLDNNDYSIWNVTVSLIT